MVSMQMLVYTRYKQARLHNINLYLHILALSITNGMPQPLATVDYSSIFYTIYLLKKKKRNFKQLFIKNIYSFAKELEDKIRSKMGKTQKLDQQWVFCFFVFQKKHLFF